MDCASVPIVPKAVEPGGPAIFIVPGPTNISFHLNSLLPMLYVNDSDGNKSPSIDIYL